MGKLCSNKGKVGIQLIGFLIINDIQAVTKEKSHKKNSLINFADKIRVRPA